MLSILCFVSSPSVIMSIENFIKIYNGPLQRYLITSNHIGAEVQSHSELVDAAFQAELQYILLTANYKKPINESALVNPVLEQIGKVRSFGYVPEPTPHIFHVKVIEKSIGILEWITNSYPVEFVERTITQTMVCTDQLLSALKYDDAHIEWVNAWLETLKQLEEYVRRYHRKGVTWAGQNDFNTALLGDIPIADRSLEHSALFEEIRKGEDIVRRLRQVRTSRDNTQSQTDRNDNASTSGEIFALEGNKWRIEHVKGDHKKLTIEEAGQDKVVYIHDCTNCTLLIENKVNMIKLESCERISVICKSLIIGIEVIQCKEIILHTFGILPMVNIDSSNGIHIHVTRKSLNTQVLTCLSSDVTINYPLEDGYCRSFNIPTRLMTTITPEYTLKTDILRDD